MYCMNVFFHILQNGMRQNRKHLKVWWRKHEAQNPQINPEDELCEVSNKVQTFRDVKAAWLWTATFMCFLRNLKGSYHRQHRLGSTRHWEWQDWRRSRLHKSQHHSGPNRYRTHRCCMARASTHPGRKIADPRGSRFWLCLQGATQVMSWTTKHRGEKPIKGRDLIYFPKLPSSFFCQKTINFCITMFSFH